MPTAPLHYDLRGVSSRRILASARSQAGIQPKDILLEHREQFDPSGWHRGRELTLLLQAAGFAFRLQIKSFP